jgi:hypothetical protein
MVITMEDGPLIWRLARRRAEYAITAADVGVP